MIKNANKISAKQWDIEYKKLVCRGKIDPEKIKPIFWFIENDDDLILQDLQFDSSLECLKLWNFLLTENCRLRQARREGKKIVGTMKDLGTIPVLAYCYPEIVAFYPDGAWWIPCVMKMSDGLFAYADSLGITDAYCPVRTMIGAFENDEHFPKPDLLISSAGAICDDFSAIAQAVENNGNPILWWEIPHSSSSISGEGAIKISPDQSVPIHLFDCVKSEIIRIKNALNKLADREISDLEIARGIKKANEIRKILRQLRDTVYSAEFPPIPALEMLIAEMLAIHYCSDQNMTLEILKDLLSLTNSRLENSAHISEDKAVRVFWINPVADLSAMNLLEKVGGQLAGTDFMFGHAIDPIPENCEPINALAKMALADPMVGSATNRADKIAANIKKYNAQAVVISRIPGASHCATEGAIIREVLSKKADIPIVEIEIPPISSTMSAALETRLSALIETAKANC